MLKPMIALLLLLWAASTANAGPRPPQCWDCVESLAMALPENNELQDPTYEQGLTPASVLPALSRCSLDESELPTLETLIDVFTDAWVSGGGVEQVRQQLDQVPKLSSEDRARLVDGARQSLDTTLRHLVDHNCQLLLKSHFDEGASRQWLLRMIRFGREADAAAPAG
jgi:hypothetical protein